MARCRRFQDSEVIVLPLGSTARTLARAFDDGMSSFPTDQLICEFYRQPRLILDMKESNHRQTGDRQA
jgi:hypothetical protein